MHVDKLVIENCKFYNLGQESTIKNCKLTDINFIDNYFYNIIIENSTLLYGIVENCHWSKVYFVKSNLKLITFKDSLLNNCHFKSSSLEKINFINTKNINPYYFNCEFDGINIQAFTPEQINTQITK